MANNLVKPNKTVALTTDVYQRALTAVLGRSKATNTVDTYNAVLKQYQAQGGVIPAEPMAIATYLETAKTDSGQLYAIATLRTHLAAISAAHHSLGLPNPCDDPIVQETLKALRKERGSKQKQARALLLADIQQMCQTLTDNWVKDSRDKALLLVGWVCALRRSEISALRFEHLTLTDKGYRLYIPSSKTDKAGEGWELAIPYAQKSVAICPVTALRQWFNILSEQDITDGHVFRGINRHRQIQKMPLTGRAIDDIIKERARLADLTRLKTLDGKEEMGVSGHSLRAGLITQAAIDALPDWMIQKTSRHASREMLQRYIRSARLFEDSVAGRIL